ncbi:MAG TPA: (Fe-S)-binding protein [Candidatus Lokiarchaeia archaeon]|nr:(Fe-S)-binding protein [Candidatus Lokiarchaeia archaeon]
MSHITEIEKDQQPDQQEDGESKLIARIYDPDLGNFLKKCYQCARCSGICQYSKVQRYPPSRIIQLVLEGLENKVFESGILWNCLACNSCHQNCPVSINFAEFDRMAKYKMKTLGKRIPEENIAHKGIYTTIAELMSIPDIQPEKSLEWVPEGCEIADSGNTMFFVGCLPFFKFEFQNLDTIAASALKIIYQVEKEPIVVLKDEVCCGHDLYWGQGKLETFIKLAKKNLKVFEKAGVKTIITICAECYRTLKVDYPKLFEDFNKKFEVKHLIEYIHENWQNNKITFKKAGENNETIPFTYHDPCRLTRFLPKDNRIMDTAREIFAQLKESGYAFSEMEHNKENSLCCGVNCWMNCNDRSKALRYKRLKEAKAIGDTLITSCPKCYMHLTCLQNDIEEIASIHIQDLSEFMVDLIECVEPADPADEKEGEP